MRGQEPLALLPSAIHQRFDAFVGDSPVEEDWGTRTPEGVGIIDISGPLDQRGGWWWDGYESIQRRVNAALADRQVQSILLDISSPGGVVAGCFEACRAIRAAAVAAGKPIVAFAGEMAASAAYALACTADTIVVPDTGMVGSVGVVTARWDVTKALDEQGVRIEVITSGARKADGNMAVPITDAELAKLQGIVDLLAGIFAQWVAERRGITVDAVMALEADVFFGQSSLAVRLADQVGTKAEALALAQAKGLAAQKSRTEKRMFGQIAAQLGLKPEADEGTISSALTALVKDKERLLEASGESTVDAAVGAIRGHRVAAEQFAVLAQEVEARKREEAEAKAAAEAKAKADEHAALLQAGIDAGKITPALKEWASAQSLETLRGFLSAAQPPAGLGKQVRREEVPAGGSGVRLWESYSIKELSAMAKEDPETYAALKADAQSRGVIR